MNVATERKMGKNGYHKKVEGLCSLYLVAVGAVCDKYTMYIEIALSDTCCSNNECCL